MFKAEEVYVLVFDICSSTKILQQLISERHQEIWNKLLKDIENFLEKEREFLRFEIYKFVGDGWILLFNKDLPLKALFPFIARLEAKYDDTYKKTIEKILSTFIDKIGLKFGLDMGRLDEFLMLGRQEYTGIPLIIASRLQGAIEEKDRNPQGKVLMSKAVYRKVKGYVPTDRKAWRVTRNLKNVEKGKKYYAIKLQKRSLKSLQPR